MSESTELNPDLEENLDVEQLQSKISQLHSDLIAAENKANEHWELLLRTKADEENIRRRARIDVENAHKYGIERFARSMLNVADSLERGIESSNVNNEQIVKSLKDGMDLTLRLLLDTLDQFGIKTLNPIGEMFNPVQHEAISTQESQEVTPNSILVVVQKGFIMHDRVLRPAKVIVAKQT